eukprot:gene5378-5598_t
MRRQICLRATQPSQRQAGNTKTGWQHEPSQRQPGNMSLTGLISVVQQSFGGGEQQSEMSPYLQSINDIYEAKPMTWQSAMSDDPASVASVGVWWSSRLTPEVSVTVVTQASVDRVPQLYSQCRSWRGPLSAALYVPLYQEEGTLDHLTANNVQILEVAAEKVQELFLEVDQDPRACQLDIVLLFELYTERRAALLYPINLLRNIARAQARTPLLALVDVDMLLNAQLYRELADEEYSQHLIAGAAAKKVFVLPAFEVFGLTQVEEAAALGGMLVSRSKRFLIQNVIKGTLSGALSLSPSIGTLWGALSLLPSIGTLSEPLSLSPSIGTLSGPLSLLPSIGICRATFSVALNWYSVGATLSVALNWYSVGDTLSVALNWYSVGATLSVALNWYSGGATLSISITQQRWYSTEEEYEISYTYRYEPWVVVSRVLAPWHDIRFRGAHAATQMRADLMASKIEYELARKVGTATMTNSSLHEPTIYSHSKDLFDSLFDKMGQGPWQPEGCLGGGVSFLELMQDPNYTKSLKAMFVSGRLACYFGEDWLSGMVSGSIPQGGFSAMGTALSIFLKDQASAEPTVMKI